MHWNSSTSIWSSVNRKWIQMKCIDPISEAGCSVCAATAALELSATPNWHAGALICNIEFPVGPPHSTALYPWPYMLNQSLCGDGMALLRVGTITVWFCFKERPQVSTLLPAVRVQWKCIVWLWCSYSILDWASGKGARLFPFEWSFGPHVEPWRFY